MYFIVMTEWNYPTESGRDFHETFDSIEEAKPYIKELGDKEWENFLEVNKDIYMQASGLYYTTVPVMTVDPDEHKTMKVLNYAIHSSAHEIEDMWFLVKCIPVETYPLTVPRYRVWPDSDSRKKACKDFDDLDDAHDFACNFVHEYDGFPFRVILHIDDLETEETIETLENFDHI